MSYFYNGVGCCGCEILHESNDSIEDAFNKHYAIKSSSLSQPTFDSEGIASFTGNTAYDVILPCTNTTRDNIGFQIMPVGSMSEMSYTFILNASSAETRKELKFKFTRYISPDYAEEREEGEVNYAAPLWDHLVVTENSTKIYDSETLDTQFTGKVFIIHNDGTEANLKCYGIYAEMGSIYYGNPNVDTFIAKTPSSIDEPFQLSWEIKGSSYYLASKANPNGETILSGNGYTHLWKPDKWWLFHPNTDNVINRLDDDGPEYQGCEYPECPCYILGNLPLLYPGIKFWITGMQDSGCGASYSPNEKYAISKLNGYEVKGYWHDECTVTFNNTRWVAGDTISVAVDPDDSSCPHELTASPIMLVDIIMTATDNEEDSNLINLSVNVYAQISVFASVAGFQSSGISWQLTGTAYKDQFGQLDMSRLGEIELKTNTYQNASYVTDSFYSAIGHLAISDHSETHHPLSHAFIADNRDIDRFEVTWRIGLIGYNSEVHLPTKIADFNQIYTTAAFVLTPHYVGGGAIRRPHADAVWRSPSLVSANEYNVSFAQIEANSGIVYIQGLINALTHIPGRLATSPRHTNIPPLYIEDLTGGTYTALKDTVLNDVIGNGLDGLFYLRSPSYPEYLLKPGSTEFSTAVSCGKPFRGDGQLIAVSDMGFAKAAITLDADGYPVTDPNTWYPYSWYGGRPAAIGQLTVVFRDE